MASEFINFKELHPFQVLLIGENEVFINFGVVLSFAKNDLQTTIIPTIKNKKLLKIGDPNFEQNNILDSQGNGIIYLNIEFENIEQYLNNYMADWENFLAGKVQDPEYGEKYLSQQYIQQKSNSEEYFYQQPIFLDTPPINSIELKFFPTESNFLELANNEDFLYIDQNVKRVAIAIKKAGNLIQLINYDYCVSIPFYFQKNLLTNFLTS